MNFLNSIAIWNKILVDEVLKTNIYTLYDHIKQISSLDRT